MHYFVTQTVDGEQGQSGDEEDEEDIEAALKKEVASLKEVKPAQRRFQVSWTLLWGYSYLRVRAAKFTCPHVLDHQTMSEGNQKFTSGCPPDYQIL